MIFSPKAFRIGIQKLGEPSLINFRLVNKETTREQEGHPIIWLQFAIPTAEP